MTLDARIVTFVTTRRLLVGIYQTKKNNDWHESKKNTKKVE